MTTIELGQSTGPNEVENIVWQAAEGVRASLAEDGERVSAATLLQELEKQQLWLEQYNGAHPGSETTEGTLGPEELVMLAQLRRIFPTVDDIVGAKPYTRET